VSARAHGSAHRSGALVWAGATLVALTLLLVAARQSGAQGMDVPGCGSLLNAFGPFDYTNPAHVRDHLAIVEQFHFDRGVDSLKGHAQSGRDMLGGDLAYTLRAFPNHHRALDAMGRYQLQSKQTPAPGARMSAECYFERAMVFAPHDGVVHMVYGIYLARQGDLDAALERYLEALQMTPDSTELHYNLGLLYADMKRYDDARDQAWLAYGSGFPLLGLRNKLLRAGEWRDPPPTPAPESTPDAGSSAAPGAADESPPPDSAPASAGSQAGNEPPPAAAPIDAEPAEAQPATEEP
jgi:hypothetical protein